MRVRFAPIRNTAAVLLASALVFALPASAGQSAHYTLDPANSAVSARVGFLGIASKTAHFPDISGRIRFDPEQPGPIDLDVTLNARALKAGDRTTLDRLKGPHFFDVERYPSVRFVGRTMRMTGQRTADVDGDLTARGVTRQEMLRVTFETPPRQISRRDPVSFTGIMAIDRRNYGMRAYSLIVGNRVTITIKARMVPG